jgi:hypothetical protein
MAYATLCLGACKQSELIGMPFPNLFTGHERYLAQFSSLLYNQYASRTLHARSRTARQELTR